MLVRTLSEWVLYDEDMLVEVFEGDLSEDFLRDVIGEHYGNPALSIVDRTK